MHFLIVPLVAVLSTTGQGAKVVGQKVGHELKHEPPKVLHVLGMHRGHLEADKEKAGQEK